MEFTKEKLQEEISKRELAITKLSNTITMLQEARLKTIGQIEFLKELLTPKKEATIREDGAK